MATIMKQHIISPRTNIQKITIGIGILFVAIGLVGVIAPGFMRMHLSTAHNVIHLFSGALAIWCGYADDPKKSYGYAMGFGIVFGLLGLAGFFLGEPGYPGVGHMEADENLLRIIPNVLEFGTVDHMIHLLIAAVLLIGTYTWLKRRETNRSTIIQTQIRAKEWNK